MPRGAAPSPRAAWARTTLSASALRRWCGIEASSGCSTEWKTKRDSACSLGRGGDALGDPDLVRVHVGCEVVDGVDAGEGLVEPDPGLEVNDRDRPGPSGIRSLPGLGGAHRSAHVDLARGKRARDGAAGLAGRADRRGLSSRSDPVDIGRRPSRGERRVAGPAVEERLLGGPIRAQLARAARRRRRRR